MPNTAGYDNAVLNWIRIKVTNKLIVKLMLMMLMRILKIAKNLLRKITFTINLQHKKVYIYIYIYIYT